MDPLEFLHKKNEYNFCRIILNSQTWLGFFPGCGIFGSNWAPRILLLFVFLYLHFFLIILLFLVSLNICEWAGIWKSSLFWSPTSSVSIRDVWMFLYKWVDLSCLCLVPLTPSVATKRPIMHNKSFLQARCEEPLMTSDWGIPLLLALLMLALLYAFLYLNGDSPASPARASTQQQ